MLNKETGRVSPSGWNETAITRCDWRGIWRKYLELMLGLSRIIEPGACVSSRLYMGYMTFHEGEAAVSLDP